MCLCHHCSCVKLFGANCLVQKRTLRRFAEEKRDFSPTHSSASETDSFCYRTKMSKGGRLWKGRSLDRDIGMLVAVFAFERTRSIRFYSEGGRRGGLTFVCWTPDRVVQFRALAGALSCDIEQGTLLSQCLFSLRCIKGYWQI